LLIVYQILGEWDAPDLSIKRHVAVKVLKEGVSTEAREDFEREVEIMSAFQHDNILKLLGTVQTGIGRLFGVLFKQSLHVYMTIFLFINTVRNSLLFLQTFCKKIRVYIR